jgi:NAD(P)-dependent dehydrogenase (short-subunit alcohol dehydrogenase family)
MPSRIALITGSSRGIGRAIACQLASDGLDIAISDISALAEGLEAVRSELTARYPNQRFLAVNADVTSEVEVSQMFEEVVNTFGGLDVVSTVRRKTRQSLFIIFSEVVANAGVCPPLKPFVDSGDYQNQYH